MRIATTGRFLPYSRERMFALAADIERYPQFLRGWVAVRILRREPGRCQVEQTLSVGPLRLRFTSLAVMSPPERITVTSTEAPFRRFDLTWLIAAAADGGSQVSIAAEIAMQSRLLQVGVDRLLSANLDDTMAAFAARAHALYGPPIPK